jgi:hypothetical protein
MSVSKISVCFNAVFVVDDASCWGPGEWRLAASIDGKPVGDPDQPFVARNRQWIILDADAWSATVDVDAKGPGSTVQVQFQVHEKGKNLGQATYVLKYPFKQVLDLNLAASKTGGGIFSSAHSRYSLKLVVQILQEKATISLPGKSDFYVNRQANGTQTFSTLSDARLVPRVEICPVVPVPAAKSLPKRPQFPAAFAAAKPTAQAATVPLSPGSNPNALPNPAVIPILLKSDTNMATKAARIAVTYLEPGNLDTSFLAWSIKSGPVAFFGDTDGKTEVLAYGTGTGATDQEAIIELRWDKNGPLLSTYRALVGKMKEIPYRALVLNPSKNTQKIRSTPDDVAGHIAIANVLLWQAGLKLVADKDKTEFDGTTLNRPGVFSLTLPKKLDNWSIGVDTDHFPEAARLNFRPGVLNIVYVKSTVNNVPTETDRPLLDGKNATDNGSPSTSWVQPSGVPPLDNPAGTVTMNTNSKTQRLAPSDVKAFPHGNLSLFNKELRYLKRRMLPYTANHAMTQLFAVLIPDYTDASNPNYGASLAHVTCRVLGLLDRGFSFGGDTPGSEDGINLPNGMGYPFWENLMSSSVCDWSQDLDIIQAKALRRHPLWNPSLPALDADPTRAAGFDHGPGYPGDEEMIVWSLASPYSFVGYYLRVENPDHVHSGHWMGKRAQPLEEHGWKVLPIYWGYHGDDPADFTTAHGNTDGAEAAAKMKQEGFPNGTYVFLDFEPDGNFTPEMRNYLTAWVSTVAGGDYRPGLYCYGRHANDVKSAALAGVANTPGVEPRYWITGNHAAGKPPFTVDSDPHDSGCAFAASWQDASAGQGGILETYEGVPINIDQNVSSSKDPAGGDAPAGDYDQQQPGPTPGQGSDGGTAYG